MNTTPADAGELAAHHRVPDRGARRGRGSSARPTSSLAAVRDALAGEGVAVGAQNVHHELAGAYTGEVSRADAGRPRHVGASSATPSGAATSARPTS